MTAENLCVWVYAVTDGEPGASADMIGVGGGPVRVIRAARLTAVAGDVSLAEFGEAPLRRNLEDLDWLAQTARAHHAVIETVAKGCPVVPMRLATVFASDSGVAGLLRDRAEDFRRVLARLRGRSEWGVKAYAARPADPGPAAQAGQAAPASPVDSASPAAPAARGEGAVPGEEGARAGSLGPGAAYLQRRRAQLAANHDARREAVASAQAVHAELGRLAVAARLYPPQAPDLTGQPTPMVLNAAYLVAEERAEEFTAAVTNLTAAHPSVELTLTGPWPAYSFVGESEVSPEGTVR